MRINKLHYIVLIGFEYYFNEDNVDNSLTVKNSHRCTPPYIHRSIDNFFDKGSLMRHSFQEIEKGVAENVGRLRSLFGQFWSTFAVFRSINWLVRKLLVMLGLRNECEFKAWAEAMAASPNNLGPHQQLPNGTSWPILLFFGVIAAAPYIVHKMLTGLTNTINEKLHEPATWQSPLRAIAEFDFEATHGHELSFNANQVLHLAPQHLQGNMWNSGWLVASIDMIKAGVIPANYIKVIV
ncbi:hypothetical protein O3G_MSEX013889 [Manduca sexta]|uniref:SH3 domain-containing protein n=1 Tax=Manduca sexta TaxID=7130 RepID=A0A921ZSA9_MANSE|nr:hypothetical protein O3G_MSEX013889 [Manduca sexta]